jgi:hypothetical protein
MLYILLLLRNQPIAKGMRTSSTTPVQYSTIHVGLTTIFQYPGSGTNVERI